MKRTAGTPSRVRRSGGGAVTPKRASGGGGGGESGGGGKPNQQQQNPTTPRRGSVGAKSATSNGNTTSNHSSSGTGSGAGRTPRARGASPSPDAPPSPPAKQHRASPSSFASHSGAVTATAAAAGKTGRRGSSASANSASLSTSPSLRVSVSPESRAGRNSASIGIPAGAAAAPPAARRGSDSLVEVSAETRYSSHSPEIPDDNAAPETSGNTPVIARLPISRTAAAASGSARGRTRNGGGGAAVHSANNTPPPTPRRGPGAATAAVGGGGGGGATAVGAVGRRPLTAPVVHIRIRPVLPRLGETNEKRRVWFLDHENLVVRKEEKSSPKRRVKRGSKVAPTAAAASAAGKRGSAVSVSTPPDAALLPTDRRQTTDDFSAVASDTDSLYGGNDHSHQPHGQQQQQQQQPQRRRGGGGGQPGVARSLAAASVTAAAASGSGPFAAEGAAAAAATAASGVNTTSNTTATGAPAASGKEQHYSFEFVHNEETSQEEVFEESVLRFVDEALLAQNIAILCYGPTGSGKTFSMMGIPHTDPHSKAAKNRRQQQQQGSVREANAGRSKKSGSGESEDDALVGATIVNTGGGGGNNPLGDDDTDDWPLADWSSHRRGTPSASLPRAASPSVSRSYVSEMGILPRLVHVLLDRKGETIVLANEVADPTAAAAAAAANTATSEVGTSASAAAGDASQPPASYSVALTLQEITFYGVEIYVDELSDLLDPAKRAVQLASDTGGLQALCRSLDRSRELDAKAHTPRRAGNSNNNNNNNANNSNAHHETGGGIAINSLEDLRRAYHLACRNRVTSSHQKNDASSRSHAIFIIELSFDLSDSRRADGEAQRVRSYVALVDLAGCERVKDTKVEGAALREAQYINKSLSALSSVVLALFQRSSHIPYRDSKLTRLLRPCLEDGRVLTLVHVAPCAGAETVNSLKFADQVQHAHIPTHSFVGNAGKKQLLDIFEDLIDPTHGQLEEEVHQLRDTYARLCAEVRLAHLEREPVGDVAAGDAPENTNTFGNNNSNNNDTLFCSAITVDGGGDVSYGVDDTAAALSFAAAGGSEETDDGSGAGGGGGEAARRQRRRVIEQLAHRGVAELLRRERADSRRAVAAIEAEKARRVGAAGGQFQERVRRLREEIEEMGRYNAQLAQEAVTPLPTDAYTQELARQIRELTEEAGACERERWALQSVVETLRQRDSQQRELAAVLEASVEESQQGARGNIESRRRSSLRLAAASSVGSGSPRGSRSGSGPGGAAAAAEHEGDVRELGYQQVLLGQELSSLRLEAACFALGDGVWEGLWARAMRQELLTAARVEQKLMETILLEPAALQVLLAASADPGSSLSPPATRSVTASLPREGSRAASGTRRASVVRVSEALATTVREEAAMREVLSNYLLRHSSSKGEALPEEDQEEEEEEEGTLDYVVSPSSVSSASTFVPSDEGGEQAWVSATTAPATTSLSQRARNSSSSTTRKSTAHRREGPGAAVSALQQVLAEAVAQGRLPNPMDLIPRPPAEDTTPSAGAAAGAASSSTPRPSPSPTRGKERASSSHSRHRSHHHRHHHHRSNGGDPGSSTRGSVIHGDGGEAPPTGLSLLPPVSLLEHYAEEADLEAAAVRKLLREGLVCEVCLFNDSFPAVLEHTLSRAGAAEESGDASRSPSSDAQPQMTTQWGRLRLTRAAATTTTTTARPNNKHRNNSNGDAESATAGGAAAAAAAAFNLEFVYSHHGIPPSRDLEERLAAAAAPPPPDPASSRRRALEEMVDARPSAMELRGGSASREASHASAGSSSGAALRLSTGKTRRLLSIPLFESELGIVAHLLESGAACSAPGAPDGADASHHNNNNGSNANGGKRRRAERTAQVALELRGLPSAGPAALSALREHLRPSAGGAGEGEDSGASSKSREPVVAKRLRGGGELLLPSSCMLTTGGACTVLLRFPKGTTAPAMRTEAVETIIAALSGVLPPFAPPPAADEAAGLRACYGARRVAVVPYHHVPYVLLYPDAAACGPPRESTRSSEGGATAEAQPREGAAAAPSPPSPVNTPRRRGSGSGLYSNNNNNNNSNGSGGGGGPRAATGAALQVYVHVPEGPDAGGASGRKSQQREARRVAKHLHLAAGALQRLRDVAVPSAATLSAAGRGGGGGDMQANYVHLTTRLQQLHTFRKGMRALVKQQIFDAEDIKGELATDGDAAAQHLASILLEAQQAVGLSLPGAASPPAALAAAGSAGGASPRDRGPFSAADVAASAAHGEVHVHEGRALCGPAVPWTLWQWAYRWPALARELGRGGRKKDGGRREDGSGSRDKNDNVVDDDEADEEDLLSRDGSSGLDPSTVPGEHDSRGGGGSSSSDRSSLAGGGGAGDSSSEEDDMLFYSYGGAGANWLGETMTMDPAAAAAATPKKVRLPRLTLAQLPNFLQDLSSSAHASK